MQFHKKDLITIPNILTYIRFLLIPAFMIIYLKTDSLAGNLWAVACVLASAVTDIADGKIARKTGQITDIGKILDPVADKFMEFAMMFCIAFKYPLVIILFVLFAVKEIVSLCFSSYLLKHGKTTGGAIWCGKLCTVILYIGMLIFLIIPNISQEVEIAIVVICGFFMILSFVVYMSRYIKLLKELRKEERRGTPAAGDAGNA